jgi:pantothenate kinase type III
MLLAIEQGNTNSLFAVHDGDDWIRPMAIGYRAQPHRR